MNPYHCFLVYFLAGAVPLGYTILTVEDRPAVGPKEFVMIVVGWFLLSVFWLPMVLIMLLFD